MTALCSGKICTIFPEKGALNLWKACTIALEYLISAVAVREGISLFAESNFRLFQHEGVISVPLEESPVLRIGFAYKKAGEYTPAMDCFLHFMADSQKY